MNEKPTLYLSNMTLAGVRNPGHVVWGYQHFDQVAEDIGVPYIQQHPLRTPLLELQNRLGYLTYRRDKSRIRALHTSWRGEHHWYTGDGQYDVWHHPARLRAAYSMAFLPYRSDRDTLRKIQTDLGVGRLPLLAYTEDVPGRADNISFRETVVQISDSQMEQWNVTSVTEFIAEAERRNVKLALDLALFRKLPEARGDAWQEAIIPILENQNTAEVHFPLVREDFGDNGDDLRQFLGGNMQSPLYKFLGIIKDTGWNRRLVLEGSIDGILNTLGEKKMFLGRRKVTRVLREIVTPIEESLGIT